MIVTRFAPSPTGHIHLGNARVAVLCYCLARQQNGRFILRMDDTDRERSQDCFAEQIQSKMKDLDRNLTSLLEEFDDVFAIQAYCFLPNHLHMMIHVIDPDRFPRAR